MADVGLIGQRGGEEYLIQDDRKILEFYAAHREDPNAALACAVMSDTEFGGQDLSQLAVFSKRLVLL
ncbi:MAG: hypothetical protein LUC48_11725 [Clostridiales bacterium]|nr:hypothetical protein [Clostridiales bacterium]